MWDLERVKRLIAEQIEERQDLEYKSSGSLEKKDGKKSEIVKDVTAMANSTGGTIIYGIKEYDQQEMRHLPEKIDGINRYEYPKEWLESIINNSQPRIQGISIEIVYQDDGSDGVVYVVVIPQSFTAHQNSYDKKYYKRFNFSSEPMSDYEIRDTMNRGTHPIIDITLKISGEIQHLITDNFMSRTPGQIREGPKTETSAYLYIYAENLGNFFAKTLAGYIKMPYVLLSKYMREGIVADENGFVKVRFDNIKRIYDMRKLVGEREIPVLPGMKEEIDTIALDYESVRKLLGQDIKIEWEVFTETSRPRSGAISYQEIKTSFEENRYKVDLLGQRSKIL